MADQKPSTSATPIGDAGGAGGVGKKPVFKNALPDLSTLDATSARARRLDVAAHVGKTTIIPSGGTGAAIGGSKRGRGPGFYCDACDLTFKDNVQLVEHLNSRSHLARTGQSGRVAAASVDDVRERLRALAARQRARAAEEAREGELDLGARLRVRAEQEAREREDRRRRRNEKRRKNKGSGGDGGTQQQESWEGRLGVIA